MMDQPPLEIITGGRQSGKTTRMLFWLQDNPETVMIVHSANERQRLLEQHKAWLDPSRLILHGTAAQHRVGRLAEFGVDNLDLVLQDIFGAKIVRATMTDEIIVRKTRLM